MSRHSVPTFEIKDFCQNPPNDFQILIGPTFEPKKPNRRRHLVERHVRYRLHQIYFLYKLQYEAFKTPSSEQLGLVSVMLRRGPLVMATFGPSG
jgi:hypothetical protein